MFFLTFGQRALFSAFSNESKLERLYATPPNRSVKSSVHLFAIHEHPGVESCQWELKLGKLKNVDKVFVKLGHEKDWEGKSASFYLVSGES